MTTPHAYMLVFHFPPQSPLTSADIEDDIAEAIHNEDDDPNADHFVDGNEIGEAIDIFVATRDPSAAFKLCEPLFERLKVIDTMIAAHRPADGGDFTVIHPPGFIGDFAP